MTDQDFTVRVTVRGYETDAQGHLNQAVYLQYAEHARWEYLQAAGVRQADLLAKGVGPVVLETTVKYRRELRAGDEVDVSCAFVWGGGKTFEVVQRITRTDGVLAAEIRGVGGFLDLAARRLVDDASAPMRSLAADPELLGLER
ncbi:MULTISPECIES: acyl-CoA thioesterase [Kitasatospora]|uniref:Acyl-CoA thioester hydrolase n=2 Tax=Kitasatospora TaxID=2063 RepID=A0ABT1IT64_9ACTN|nr:acyl-CoA thioesterase [Kitasatospora paracochleata]MCP2308328.1 acyl-CoA thioester hydrolase [Kitasatospora paracochleata]